MAGCWLYENSNRNSWKLTALDQLRFNVSCGKKANLVHEGKSSENQAVLARTTHEAILALSVLEFMTSRKTTGIFFICSFPIANLSVNPTSRSLFSLHIRKANVSSPWARTISSSMETTAWEISIRLVFRFLSIRKRRNNSPALFYFWEPQFQCDRTEGIDSASYSVRWAQTCNDICPIWPEIIPMSRLKRKGKGKSGLALSSQGRASHPIAGYQLSWTTSGWLPGFIAIVSMTAIKILICTKKRTMNVNPKNI